MKEKISVLTFWTSNSNYGQILQGYALQTFLKNNGYNSSIIRFDSWFSKIKVKLHLLIKGKLKQDAKQKSLRKFDNFRKEHILYSNKKYNFFYSLVKSPPKSNYYIVGSDQVWAYMRNKERRNGYLLNFGNKDVKKIAYAASFGRDFLNKDEIDDYKAALSKFSFIGVREETGMAICDSLGADTTWVTDPVALITAKEWRSLESTITINTSKKPTLFLYSLMNGQQNPNLRQILKGLDKNYEIYYTNSSEMLDENCVLYPSVTEWLSYIDKCDYIVTDSFHCTMFCIIFRKTFVTIKRGNGTGMSNRLTSMLKRIGLLDRYTECSLESITTTINQPISWDRCNKELNDWITTSKNALLNQFI